MLNFITAVLAFLAKILPVKIKPAGQLPLPAAPARTQAPAVSGLLPVPPPPARGPLAPPPLPTELRPEMAPPAPKKPA